MKQIDEDMNKRHIALPIPSGLEEFLQWLLKEGFSSWIVGGAVRNVLLGISPRDWDIITDAPEEKLFQSPFKVIPVGARFGIILVILSDGVPVEVGCIGKTTTHGTLEADISRRDFTINAIAVSYGTGELIDPFGGIKDLQQGIIRGVGDPKLRFLEDPLRVLRAARFVSEYGFSIERKTYLAMKETAHLLENVAVERIRDEFFKLLSGEHVKEGLEISRKAGILRVFFPEILEGWRKRQNDYHAFHIYRHIIETVSHTPPRLRVRLAALFHDIAKPRVRQKIGNRYRFFGHEKLSAEMAENILARWKTNQALVEEVSILVRNHMVHDVDRWSDGAIRRLINRVGEDLLEDLIDLLRADRMAHGVNAADTEDVDLLEERIRKLKDHYPHTVSELPVNGHDVMNLLGVKPGPHIGLVLRALHNHIIDHPEDNKREVLLKMIPRLWESINQGVKVSQLDE